MQKVRCHFYLKLQLIVSIKFQNLFTFPSRYLIHYQTLKIIDFEGGPPNFEQNMTCFILILY